MMQKIKLSWRQRFRAFLLGEGMPYPLPISAPVAIVGSYNGMTLSLWQDSAEHVAWAREILKTDKFRDMLAVLQNSFPRVNPLELDPVRAGYELGRRVGMTQMFQQILRLTETPPQTPPEIPADYSSEEVFSSWQSQYLENNQINEE